LVAAAAKDPVDRIVVTREHSAPSKIRSRRKVPDVCKTCGVRAIDDFTLWRHLDFRIP
jgi:hypothetical protein